MADILNATTSSSHVADVVPIYDAMLQRADDLALSGAILEAADLLTTAAETMRRFEHPEAMRVAGWARDVLKLID